MDSLLAELEQKCGESYADEIAGVRRDMEAFMDQKAAMFHAYTLTGKKRYKYKATPQNTPKEKPCGKIPSGRA